MLEAKNEARTRISLGFSRQIWEKRLNLLAGICRQHKTWVRISESFFFAIYAAQLREAQKQDIATALSS